MVGTNDVQYKSLLDYYHRLCSTVGPLPSPRVVNVDHGQQRFLLFALPGWALFRDARAGAKAA